MRARQLQDALQSLEAAICDVSSALAEMRKAHDPLASHIFVSRRHYQTMSDTKSGHRHETAARLSWQKATDLGFRGDLHEWKRLLGAAPRRD